VVERQNNDEQSLLALDLKLADLEAGRYCAGRSPAGRVTLFSAIIPVE